MNNLTITNNGSFVQPVSNRKFPNEILRKMFVELPVFQCLELMSVSKEMKKIMDSNEFFHENLQRNPAVKDFKVEDCGLSLRNQIVLKAKNELRNLAKVDEKKRRYDDLNTYEKAELKKDCPFINEIEMIKAHIKKAKWVSTIEIVGKLVSDEFKSDKKFVFDLWLKDVPYFLELASYDIQKDKKFALLYLYSEDKTTLYSGFVVDKYEGLNLNQAQKNSCVIEVARSIRDVINKN